MTEQKIDTENIQESEKEAKAEAAKQAYSVDTPKKSKKNKKFKFSKLFWVTVIIPTACSLVYFSAWASDRYTSESSFVVRSPHNQSSISGLGALLQNVGFSRAQDDTYTVREYMSSRSALATLEKSMPIRFFMRARAIFSAASMVLACLIVMKRFINTIKTKSISLLMRSPVFRL